ncbi:MAG: succinate dehydrogenase iron-sulfur subunit [Gammaproteobacteria bacterium]|uniref:Succinate dehydrogenase iron-sulfur subunit n=1 Tax=Candidatus Thiopontia autotrophica TaxID=2841688 RepID=A0A8J6TNL0_9GAMM|nr:succinate dehydrogenase iron-sulfur subunit [Candidatus Thiopontia autotrophica]MBL6968963.1 succinate dehydrogenase iron-sulfur subunit [Gammaproteobacteria bacterium]
MRFLIYRFDPEQDSEPRMQEYLLDDDLISDEMMVLSALKLIKAEDESLSFRKSCGEGVCGSDGMNINGSNSLACITPLKGLKEPVEIRPFPGQPVIRDLIVDMDPFFRQYRAVKPWLTVDDQEPEVEYRQSPEERERLDGLYECILCGCCSTACPSFWWNPKEFLGPAALLQAWRFVSDSRDQATDERLHALEGPFKLFRCRTIMNCTNSCPKGLNPSDAIGKLRGAMLKRSL